MHLRIKHRDPTKQYILRLSHEDNSKQTINVPAGYAGEDLISFPIQTLNLSPATVVLKIIPAEGEPEILTHKVGPGNWATDFYELIPD